MKQENTQIFFYGFIVGCVLLLMPIPHFAFWSGIMEHIEAVFRYLGFVLFAACGLTIVVGVGRAYMGK
ncbi:hypothetical protein [Paenibacillus soyae]|uniref:Uncharacterized protein n=1 Tax=Paenibacillus soyae TaxID=2969249 RepID=A0A9X2SC63_9BACL|nr:hypothetical protein [Paenibacillus soyae]MCR2805687.1 hypothetical protein [Paenibacillus soyae]